MSDPSILGGDVAQSATLKQALGRAITSALQDRERARWLCKQLLLTPDGVRAIVEFERALEHRFVGKKRSITVEMSQATMKLYVASGLACDNLSRRSVASNATAYALTGDIRLTRYRQTVPRMTVSDGVTTLEFTLCRPDRSQPLAWRLQRAVTGSSGKAVIRPLSHTSVGSPLR